MIGQVKKLLANTFYKTIDGLVINVIRFVAIMIVVRLLPKPEYGIYSFVYTVVNVALILTSLGIPTAATQHVSKYAHVPQEAAAYCRYAVGIRLLITGGTAILLFALSGFIGRTFGHPEAKGALELGIVLYFFLSCNMLLDFIFAGFEKYKSYLLWVTLPAEMLRVLLVIAFAITGFTLKRVLGVEIAAPAMAVALGLFLTRDVWKGERVAVNAKQFVLFALSIAPITTITVLFDWTSLLIISYFLSPSVLAEFNVSIRLLSIGPILFPIGSAVILPTLLTLSQVEKSRLVNEVFKLLLPILAPAVIFVAIFARQLLGLYGGAAYVDAYPILAVLSVLLLLRILSPVFKQVLIACEQSKTLLVITVVSGLFNFVMACALVGPMGVMGVASSIVAAEMLVFIGMWWALSKMGLQLEWRKFLLIVVSACPLFVALIPNGLLFRLAVFSAIYAVYVGMMVRFVLQEPLSRLVRTFQTIALERGPAISEPSPVSSTK